MDTDAVLGWIRSFEGVDDTNCPDFDSLRDGIALGVIFNQLNDEPADFNPRALDPSKDDWVTALRNLRTLNEKIKPAFEAAKVPLKLDTSGIARRSNQDALPSLIECFIMFSIKGPKKTEQIQKIKTLSKETQRAIKSVIEKAKSVTARPPATPTKETEAPATPTVSRSTQLLQRQLKNAQDEKKRLEQEKAELEKEKQKLVENQGTVKKTKELIEYEAVCERREQLEREGKELEQKLKAKEGVIDEKKRMQSEVDSITARVRDLKRKLNLTAPTIESFRDSTDLKVQKYLADIDEAERRLKPEFEEALKTENAKIKAAARKISQDVRELTEMVGEVGDTDDGSTKLADEITELVEKTNGLNDETMKMIARTEAIERLKQQQSFLEHLRSSTQFIKPT